MGVCYRLPIDKNAIALETRLIAHTCQLKLKAIYGACCTITLALIPSPLLPQGEGELNLLLPSPGGRGAGGEGKTFAQSGFHVKLTPILIASLQRSGD
ncbi:hypothetical protein NIES37_15830 [Tolypothrix tenuis PCC 7101]|uniref:Uncharacterized protein n=1 Tax=Tolypothrix tenuis PCC 7101 TaxID=231146 RepID=A0A1Z4MVX0_9CYAN|nr:hypothetical protein NIES37_15830 [Tolypothrix tenuis PCC 7101]